MNVGITFFVRPGAASIWNNGADQNCVFLWMLLRLIPGVRVFAITGSDTINPSPAMMLTGLGIEFVRIDDVIDQLDVLIEAGAQVSAEHVARVRNRGGRAVAYRFGNAFVIDAERVIHGKDAGAIFNGARFDEVWTNRQHVATCGSYWETCYRAPVRVLPHIWEPTFVDAAVREFPSDLKWGYQSTPEAGKRVSVFEPNINIVKTCVMPLLVIEQAYRRRPALLSAVYVTNAIQLKEHLTFREFAGNLDVQKAGLCSFEARFNTPWFLAKFTDVVVSHQWENALNYAYYDALYGGYPLVHNSDLLPDGVGYRYHDFDAQSGARALIDALSEHDQNVAEYQSTASSFLATVRATAPANVDAHARALARLTGARSLSTHSIGDSVS